VTPLVAAPSDVNEPSDATVWCPASVTSVTLNFPPVLNPPDMPKFPLICQWEISHIKNPWYNSCGVTVADNDKRYDSYANSTNYLYQPVGSVV